MRRLLGFLLLLAGAYFLGNNIVFSTYYSPYFWRNLPAMGSVLAIMGGVISLLCFPRQAGRWGWILIILGIIMVFLSGGVMLRPTTLWSFLVSFAALVAGYRLVFDRPDRF